MKGQNIGFIDDTTYFKYEVDSNHLDMDSLIMITVWEKINTDWKIYFDHNKTQLAYESNLKGDSCIQIHYWRDGKIKQKDSYIRNKEVKTDFIWVHEIRYCRNGQLILDGAINNFDELLSHVTYYCNGQKKIQWSQKGFYSEGLYTIWYETGQKKLEGNYISGKENGEWKYWNDKGKLQKIEIYKEGKLIKTK